MLVGEVRAAIDGGRLSIAEVKVEGNAESHVLTIYSRFLRAAPPDVEGLREACSEAKAAMQEAWHELGQWRRFARCNAEGIDLGEAVGIPDPPQRPNRSAADETQRVMDRLSAVLRRFQDAGIADPGPDGEGSDTD